MKTAGAIGAVGVILTAVFNFVPACAALTQVTGSLQSAEAHRIVSQRVYQESVRGVAC